MKIFKTFNFLVIILTFLFIQSCKSDEPIEPSNTDFVSVKVDGDLFEPSLIIVGIVDEEDSIFEFAQFTISGIKSPTDTETVLITFLLPFEEMIVDRNYSFIDKTCEAPIEEACGFASYSPGTIQGGVNVVSNIVGASCNFTFTSIDYRKGGNASGTFFATLKSQSTGETVELTEGEFNVQIPE